MIYYKKNHIDFLQEMLIQQQDLDQQLEVKIENTSQVQAQIELQGMRDNDQDRV